MLMYDPFRIWGQPENTYNFIFEDMNEWVMNDKWQVIFVLIKKKIGEEIKYK